MRAVLAVEQTLLGMLTASIWNVVCFSCLIFRADWILAVTSLESSWSYKFRFVVQVGLLPG